MVIQIIDDITQYRVFFNLSKDNHNDRYDSVDLLFRVGVLKTTKDKDCKFLFPIFKPYAIAIRILFYSLMDYSELSHSTEFKTFQFVDWLSSGKRYRDYLILVWITKKLKEDEKDNYYFKKYGELLDTKDKSNLKDFNVFDIIDIDKYKKSTLKNYTMNKTKITKAIYLLSNSVFIDIFDKVSSTDENIKDSKNLTNKTRTYEVIKLNRAFNKVRRKFQENWLF